MECAGPPEYDLEPLTKILIVNGLILNSQTRSILTLLSISDFTLAKVMKRELWFPVTIEEGQSVISGSLVGILAHMESKEIYSASKLKPQDFQEDIEDMLTWHSLFMQVAMNQVLMHFFDPKYSNKQTLFRGIEFWVKKVVKCVRIINRKLEGHRFLCSKQMSVADVIVYSDVSLFVKLTQNFEDPWLESFENVIAWMKQMQMNNHISQIDGLLDKALSSQTSCVSELKVSKIAKLDSNEAKKFANSLPIPLTDMIT